MKVPFNNLNLIHNEIKSNVESRFKKVISSIILSVVTLSVSLAQCAMCKAQGENFDSEKAAQVAEAQNTAILFLAFAPYLLLTVFVSAIIFYYKKKKKEFDKSEASVTTVE